MGDLERCPLRPGIGHSADGWRDALVPAIERYRERNVRLYFHDDAVFASPDIYDYLVAEDMLSVGRPPNHVRRFYTSFDHQAGLRAKKCRVVAKVEWHPGKLYPRVDFVVPNLGRPADGQTVLGVGVGGKRSALPTQIEIRIAVENPNGYADG